MAVAVMPTLVPAVAAVVGTLSCPNSPSECGVPIRVTPASGLLNISDPP